MPLSWNEIKSRATAFSKEWENEVSEDAEAKSFWDDFFNVFGIGRRRVATFEQQVKKIDQKDSDDKKIFWYRWYTRKGGREPNYAGLRHAFRLRSWKGVIPSRLTRRQ